MRFGFEIVNISDVAAKSGFEVFSSAVAEGGGVRAINVKGGAIFSRKEIDSLALFAKAYRAKGVMWNKKRNGESSSSYAKKLTDNENDAIAELCGFEDGDLILIVADKNDEIVFNSLGALRIECAKRLGLLKSDDYKFLWVTDFPLFEYSEEEGRYMAKHHPFSMPNAEDIDMIETNPGKVRAIAYDIVLNGTELGGGSIRIHDSVIQERMFKALGFTTEEAKEKFEFLLEAFRYGVPPHGGMAFGLDRLVMKVFGVEDIKDVIAFPKIQNATEPMSKCPGFTDEKALSELGISITDTEKE
jgi:aspartyl-tRNA synthetase